MWACCCLAALSSQRQRVTRSRRTGIAGSSGGGNPTATARQNRASSLTALQGNVGDLGVVHGRGHAHGALTTLGGTRHHTRTLCLAYERAAAGIPTSHGGCVPHQPTPSRPGSDRRFPRGTRGSSGRRGYRPRRSSGTGSRHRRCPAETSPWSPQRGQSCCARWGRYPASWRR